MSWIRRRPLTSLAALALLLRFASAAATELNPLFPAYYYTDANLVHANASAALDAVRAGRAPVLQGSRGERVQTSISLAIYRAVGPRPFAVKLFNALLGALAVAAFARALSLIFPVRAALAAGLLLAVWPSHVFYTSQNLKEAPVALLAFAALGLAFASGFNARAARSRAVPLALAAAAALLAAGFYRSYVLACLGPALLLGLALSARRLPRTNAASAAAALLAALALYPFLSSAPADDSAGAMSAPAVPSGYARAWSAESLSGFRRSRLAADRVWAETRANREIGTQLYPDAEFKTWLDVLLYLPKGAFAVLFMPLPGLYPLEGKPGRWAAAGENVVLLALAGLGLAGAARGAKTPARLSLLAFFAAMTAGAALLEFDLGSAGRHKLLYLPMLFPFAAEEALRLLGKEPV